MAFFVSQYLRFFASLTQKNNVSFSRRLEIVSNCCPTNCSAIASRFNKNRSSWIKVSMLVRIARCTRPISKKSSLNFLSLKEEINGTDWAEDA